MAFTIFFSHGNQDRDWVQHIARSIENEGVEFYLFEWDVRPGQSIAQKIQHAIESCDLMFVLLTRNSESSAYVQQEIGYAKAKGKLVIPLVEDGTSKRSLAMLGDAEYVPFDTNTIDQCVHTLTVVILGQIAAQKDKLLGGLTREQWMAIAVAVLLIALGLYVAYRAGGMGGLGGMA